MLTYANDYKEELQRLGPAGFRRVFFQPVLVAWALWSTGGWTALRQSWSPSTAS